METRDIDRRRFLKMSAGGAAYLGSSSAINVLGSAYDITKPQIVCSISTDSLNRMEYGLEKAVDDSAQQISQPVGLPIALQSLDPNNPSSTLRIEGVYQSLEQLIEDAFSVNLPEGDFWATNVFLNLINFYPQPISQAPINIYNYVKGLIGEDPKRIRSLKYLDLTSGSVKFDFLVWDDALKINKLGYGDSGRIEFKKDATADLEASLGFWPSDVMVIRRDKNLSHDAVHAQRESRLYAPYLATEFFANLNSSNPQKLTQIGNDVDIEKQFYDPSLASSPMFSISPFFNGDSDILYAFRYYNDGITLPAQVARAIIDLNMNSSIGRYYAEYFGRKSVIKWGQTPIHVKVEDVDIQNVQDALRRSSLDWGLRYEFTYDNQPPLLRVRAIKPEDRADPSATGFTKILSTNPDNTIVEALVAVLPQFAKRSTDYRTRFLYGHEINHGAGCEFAHPTSRGLMNPYLPAMYLQPEALFVMRFVPYLPNGSIVREDFTFLKFLS